jgi:hypothetical protein
VGAGVGEGSGVEVGSHRRKLIEGRSLSGMFRV